METPLQRRSRLNSTQNETASETSGESLTIYFDGVCNLCNASVNWIILRDMSQIFSYASLQGESARSNLPPHIVNSLSSIILRFPDGRLFFESDAVIEILKRLPGYAVWASLLGLLPRFFRNFFYQLIAKNRYRLFGKRDTCRLPTPEEKARFLP